MAQPFSGQLHDLLELRLGGSPQAMAQFLKAEYARWGAAIKEANVKLE